MLFAQSLPLATVEWSVAIGLAVAAAGVAAAAVWFLLRAQGQAAEVARRAEAERLIAEARAQSAKVVKDGELEAQKKLLEVTERFERESAETRKELREAEKRMEKREDMLDKKLDVLSTKERKIEQGEQRLAQREGEIEQQTTQAKQLVEQQRGELLRISRMSPEQARELCLRRTESEVEREAGEMVERIVGEAQEKAKEKARNIIVGAIQRYAAEHTCETTVATIDVASDEMKGRVIGREGRNIRAFEKVTGAQVIVDDTPGIVSISCMDPVRKEVARIALERLIKDGRIHPTRIEELVAETQKEIDARIVEAGKQAAIDANVPGVPKKMLDIMGRLQYRTSYGQNVLRHSVEVAYLCGMMADELGLDGSLARRAGLLHDIGKALEHEVEGAHTKTGYEFARRFGESEAVLNAILGHHGDVSATTPYTPLVTAADAMSAARPGSRRESLERYIKRLQELESVATSFPGVKLAYAIEAGREVRVIVDAVRIDDRSSLKLARDIARRIEEQLQTFPGEIKVTVLREVRATEYAISGRHRGEERRPVPSLSDAPGESEPAATEEVS